MARVLFAGESWSVLTVHTKGFDSMATSRYEEAGGPFIAALESAGHTVVYQPSHVAAEHFPATLAELEPFDVVVLSDIGSNTLLVRPETWLMSKMGSNRLAVLRDWIAGGGGFVMVGGYFSFQGLEGKANYRSTPLAEALPVELEVGDDRQEVPQGGVTKLTGTAHPITKGMDEQWPPLLGFQRLVAKPGAEVLATVEDWPLLVADRHGQGRVVAFASDIAPHWAPPEFVGWAGYAQLWGRVVGWLAGEAI
jgi:uncharacterized membrane protein